MCEVTCNEGDKEQAFRAKIEIKNLAETAGMFKALSDPTRLKIVYALTLDELCVCEVSSIVGISIATASHHLRLLRDLGLATYRKEGKLMYYTIANTKIYDLLQVTLHESKVTISG